MSADEADKDDEESYHLPENGSKKRGPYKKKQQSANPEKADKEPKKRGRKPKNRGRKPAKSDDENKNDSEDAAVTLPKKRTNKELSGHDSDPDSPIDQNGGDARAKPHLNADNTGQKLTNDSSKQS